MDSKVCGEHSGKCAILHINMVLGGEDQVEVIELVIVSIVKMQENLLLSASFKLRVGDICWAEHIE